ncbi:MAG TPA: hypothetical protein VL096_03395 [Pirellulaceae bacterium]|nr:hypothetical protein [Pirellulaceae bacterium]
MTIRWRKFAFAVLTLAGTAGLPLLASTAEAGGPACGCQSSCGCSDSVPFSKYGDGSEPGVAPENALADSDFNLGEGAAAQSGNSFAALDAAGAYIDSAIVASRFRVRFDSAYNNPIPDRAEFFYGQCAVAGPPLLERSVDYQEITPYFEWAYNDCVSFFVETPVRFINPDINDNTAGFSDMNAGFKYALIASADEYLTLQFRAYAPTGDNTRGLGTGHTSLEPSVLYFRRLTQRLIVQAEVRDWIPIGGTELNGQNFSGNVIRYGAGFGYDVMQSCDVCSNEKLTFVSEFVGWTIMDGLGTDGGNGGGIGGLGNVVDQSGVTIVNAKLGLRYTTGADSLYAGYGTALSDQVWYQEIFRAEYSRAF